MPYRWPGDKRKRIDAAVAAARYAGAAVSEHDPADTAHQRTETLPDGALIPADLTSEVSILAQSIARAAFRLVTLRDAWLDPPEWTERVPEVVPLGMTRSPYPERIVARPWPRPTAGPTTRRRWPTRKSCGGCWR